MFLGGGKGENIWLNLEILFILGGVLGLWVFWKAEGVLGGKYLVEP